jgi:hypothetical protein
MMKRMAKSNKEGGEEDPLFFIHLPSRFLMKVLELNNENQS